MSDTEKIEFYWEAMKRSDMALELLDQLPQAEKVTITVENAQNPSGFAAIVSNGIVVSTVSGRYNLVEHRDAFRPILDGLDAAGVQYEVSQTYSKTKAFLSVFSEDVDANGDKLRIGFRAVNSYDGTTAIAYTFSEYSQTSFFELVGYRLACKNGMLIHVPLNNAEIIKWEERQKLDELLTLHNRILHTEGAGEKVKTVRLVVEAMAIMRNPIKRMVEIAKTKSIGEELAKELIGKYIGKRMANNILNQYNNEERNLWGLYNAVTWVASHKNIAKSTRQNLLNKSATLLAESISEAV